MDVRRRAPDFYVVEIIFSSVPICDELPERRRGNGGRKRQCYAAKVVLKTCWALLCVQKLEKVEQVILKTMC